MPEKRRCNRCGNPLPADAIDNTCPACMLRAGLEPASEALTSSNSGGTVATLGVEPAQPGHVLESLARTFGSVPRVLLPDTAPDDAGVAIIKPSSDEMPSPAERGDRYLLFGEIARGGMGAVLKGRDPDLGRDLAIKVLLESHEHKPEMVRRFVEEAQISGQLQHPGIVPVYELGAFSDRRPYFSMKLVKGRTFSTLLAERPSPAHDLPRLLSIFEAICQTLAYSHARGVIHRDLKPSNVMVGSFGEVQVMDWGLAKVLKEQGKITERPDQTVREESTVATLRSGSNQHESQAGSLLGTPAYMAPEQAGGQAERVNRRADVFGLGSILCEVLTGQPTYVGRSQTELIKKAMEGDTADALTRLSGCGAEAELIVLAKACLEVNLDDRPRDAKVVADRITAYLASVQERVQAAERERAVAVARAIEERRRRRVQLALAASLMAFTTLGGLSTTYYLEQRAARAAATDRVVSKAVTLRDQALTLPEDLSRWQVALAAVEQAETAGVTGAHERLQRVRSEVLAGLNAARRDRELLDRLFDIRSSKSDDPDGSATDRDYADAFRDAEIDLTSLPPAVAGTQIKARPASVALYAAVALDDWAATRRRRSNPAGAAQLSEAARVCDPDPWRNQLRTTLNQPDKAARRAGLEALEKEASYDSLGPISLYLLGTGLNAAGNSVLAESVLRSAQQRHPGDVWVNYELGRLLDSQSRRDAAVRFYTAARAIRPETAHELAHVLSDRGETDEAIEIYHELARLRPNDGRHLVCLANDLKGRGRSEDAAAALEQSVVAFRAAIRNKPDDFAAHGNLGRALSAQGKRDLAVTEYREAIRLNPKLATLHCDLGLALSAQGQAELAATEFRDAIRLNAHYAEPHSWLGNILLSQGKLDLAVAEYREAVRISPGLALAYDFLGQGLEAQGQLDLAIAEYRNAIRVKPDYAVAHNNLGTVLARQNKLDLADAEFLETIRLQPDHSMAHYNLGLTLEMRGKLDEAAAKYREAIRLDPNYAEAHCNLGQALGRLGRHAESLPFLRRGHELGMKRPGWNYPSAQWVAEGERLARMADRLPALLKGQERPKEMSERLELAQICYGKKYFAAAARFWAGALEADPKLGDDLRAGHRYNAACAAALAGSGDGADDPPLENEAKTGFRTRALDWLRADLALHAKQITAGTASARAAAAAVLQQWTRDSDLAGIRDADRLAKLPEPEQSGWRALWADVHSLLKTDARPKATQAKESGR